MKKKIFFGILFSALLAINVISISKTDVRYLSLISLIQNANAQIEDGEGKGLDCICNECSLWNPITNEYDAGIELIQIQPPFPSNGSCAGTACGYGFC